MKSLSQLLLVCLVLSATAATAQSPSAQVPAESPATKPVKELILPGESFLIEGRAAFIMWPEQAKRRSPQPWVMYSPTLPAYPDVHEKWMHQKFLDAGIAVAGIDVGEAYGSPEGNRLITALYEELTGKRDFAVKPCLLGRSRGGLWASSWAIANPGRVAAIAGIYPVFDLRTYPGLAKAAPAYRLTEAELEQQLSVFNPVSRVSELAKANIPLFLIHGDQDKVVPLKENSATVAEVYEQQGRTSLCELVVAPEQGHNMWEGFFRCERLVDFVVAKSIVEPFPGQRSDWHGFDRYDFEVDGKPVLVVAPKNAAPGRPWVWHGEFFGHKPAPDIELLRRGFHVAYMKVPDMLGSPKAVAHWDKFYQAMTESYGLSSKVALVGLSRGGLYCYNWAAANPQQVACIYGDAPVCDFKSWPGGKGKGKGSQRDWTLVLTAYGFADEAAAIAYDKNPVDNLAPLALAKVPLLHVYGDADDVVPWDENTGIVATRYTELGGTIQLIAKPGVGHHPHGLDDSAPIVEFIVKHASSEDRPGQR
jgi:pimeloyl-ACP methyl ester carboxylesterase